MVYYAEHVITLAKPVAAHQAQTALVAWKGQFLSDISLLPTAFAMTGITTKSTTRFVNRVMSSAKPVKPLQRTA